MSNAWHADAYPPGSWVVWPLGGLEFEPSMHLAPIQPQPLPGQARVGACSLCGGDVIGHRGAWFAVIPPPADQCSQCRAIRADVDDVIPMRRR